MQSDRAGCRPTVVVVGGGASGTLCAVHLLRSGAAGRVVVVEDGGRPGRGIAYGTPNDFHLLNVPAAGMSAYPDEPAHFRAWATTAQNGVRAESFLPRPLYGRYLEACLRRQEIGASGHTSLEWVHGRVNDVRPGGVPRDGRAGDGLVGAVVTLTDGRRYEADQVVLALGNSLSAPIPQLRGAAEVASPHLVEDP